MKLDASEIEVNGVKYIPKDSQVDAKLSSDYVIVRTYSAGAHAGYLNSRDGKEVNLASARRLWYWKGAASLSQMAIDGVSCPKECKFPAPTSSITLTEAIEIIPCTEKARKSICGVPVWEA